MNKPRSAVVEVMQQASLSTWRAWRRHVEAGTADSPEALALWEESKLAGSTLLDEMAARARLEHARAA